MLDVGDEILESRYKVIKTLGSGAFGEIYKGKHLFLFQRHANKTLLIVVEKLKTG